MKHKYNKIEQKKSNNPDIKNEKFIPALDFRCFIGFKNTYLAFDPISDL